MLGCNYDHAATAVSMLLLYKLMSGSVQDNFITVQSLASLLSVSPSSVYRLVASRSIRFYRVGGSVRFTKAGIDEYLAKICVEPVRQKI